MDGWWSRFSMDGWTDGYFYCSFIQVLLPLIASVHLFSTQGPGSCLIDFKGNRTCWKLSFAFLPASVTEHLAAPSSAPAAVHLHWLVCRRTIEKEEKWRKEVQKIPFSNIREWSIFLCLQIVILLSRNKWSCLVGDEKLIFKANKDLGQCNCFNIWCLRLFKLYIFNRRTWILGNGDNLRRGAATPWERTRGCFVPWDGDRRDRHSWMLPVPKAPAASGAAEKGGVGRGADL